MLILIDFITILITTVITIALGQRIYKYGLSNIIAVCEIAFYSVHVVPLILGLFVDYSAAYTSNLKNVILAVDDIETSIIYDIFVVCICFAMFLPGRRRVGWINLSSNSMNSPIIVGLCYLGMISPVVAIAFAPSSSVYFSYAYFYTRSYSVTSSEYIYHTNVMTYICMIALVSTILIYYIKYNSNAVKIVVAVSIALIVWCQGKRSYLTIALVVILVIDFLKIGSRKKRSRIILKSIIFGAIIIAYFVIYRSVVGKGSILSSVQQYELYFSRMSAVKTSIYAALNHDSMLEYSGQSFVYDFLFFVPRTIWPNKPVLFTRYYTAYAHGYSYGRFWGGGNLLANIWAEHIANFGLFGIVTAFLFVFLIARISENSRNTWVYFSGLVFITLYCVNAFSGISMYLFYVWLILLIFSKIRHLTKNKIVFKIK